MSDSPGLLDFAIGLVNPVFNLPKGQGFFLGGNSKYRRTVINTAHQNWEGGGGTLKTLGQVDTSKNLPEWQAVKPTFFAP